MNLARNPLNFEGLLLSTRDTFAENIYLKRKDFQSLKEKDFHSFFSVL